MTARQELVINGASEDFTFVISLAVYPNGSIAIAQPNDQRILFYGSDGKRLAKFGRQGQGPGEFGWINWVRWMGDTLVSYDDQLHRLTLIDSHFKLARSEPLIRALRTPLGSDRFPHLMFIAPLALYADGSALALGPVAKSATPSPWGRIIYHTGFGISDHSGAMTRFVGAAPATECTDQVLHVDIPECQFPQWRVSSDGTRLLIVEPQIVGSLGGHLLVTVVSQHGDTLLAGKYPFPVAPITSRMADSIRHTRSGASKSDLKRAGFLKVKVPPMFAPVDNVAEGQDGTTWIGLRSTSALRAWMVIGATGKWMANVMLPRNVMVMEARNGLIWGRAEDPDGIQSVVRYRWSGER